MKAMQRVFDFYLDSSVHVALAVLALAHITGLTLNISMSGHFFLFLFFGTITCYNFVKYGVEAEKYIVVVDRYHKIIQVASFIAFGLAIYHFYFLGLKVWLGVFCLVVLTGLYALPVLPHAKKLRSWGGLKIFVVATVWAAATVILPVLSEDVVLSGDAIIEALRRLLFVLILLIPFEIRDLAYDSPQLKTLPQRYGVARTKLFGAFLVIPFFFLIFLKKSVLVDEVIVNGVLFLGLGSLMFITKRHQNKYFASFWVEAIPIAWWGLYILVQELF